jgi:hypothetical protein
MVCSSSTTGASYSRSPRSKGIRIQDSGIRAVKA